jgi:hypothetical protein
MEHIAIIKSESEFVTFCNELYQASKGLEPFNYPLVIANGGAHRLVKLDITWPYMNATNPKNGHTIGEIVFGEAGGFDKLWAIYENDEPFVIVKNDVDYQAQIEDLMAIGSVKQKYMVVETDDKTMVFIIQYKNGKLNVLHSDNKSLIGSIDIGFDTVEANIDYMDMTDLIDTYFIEQSILDMVD